MPEPSELALWEQESYELESEFALQLDFPVFGVAGNLKVRVMVFGISRYADVQVEGYTHRYGVAIRALLQISETREEANLTLPLIAAKVQLGALQASRSKRQGA